MFGGIIARLGLSLVFGRLKTRLAAVPAWAWKTIAVVIALGLAVWAHQHYANKQISAAYASGWKAANDDRDKQDAEAARIAAEELAKHDGKAKGISDDERSKNDQANSRDAARADDLRLHGPGRASAVSCGPVRGSVVPASAGGHEPINGTVDAGVAGVPADQGLAGVPWTDLVEFARIYDANRNEVNSWRAWHPRQAEQTEAYRQSLEQLAAGKR